ncbi:isopeptide-forming domain-containing fimbrial protein [uncultured Enterococcus sp.]|uniref:isopeptide-forming domain-containing fimbrial protein n=1 Tax=uncultured Enterococcus sp. TaxID=167972 RepID=UPI0028E380AD|nr:isopeptide-forming domain-containing fimbrial protein [uncultured Enterococcus sp.]
MKKRVKLLGCLFAGMIFSESALAQEVSVSDETLSTMQSSQSETSQSVMDSSVCTESENVQTLEERTHDSIHIDKKQSKTSTSNMSDGKTTSSVKDNAIGFDFTSIFTNETSGDLADTAVGDIIVRTITMSNHSASVMGINVRSSIESAKSQQSSVPTVKEIGGETLTSLSGSEEVNQNNYDNARDFKLLPGDTITLVQKYEIISPTGIDNWLGGVSSLSNNYEVYAYSFKDGTFSIDATGFINAELVDSEQQNASYFIKSAEPELSVEKSVTNLSGKDFYVGDRLEYQIKVTNTVERSMLVSGVMTDQLDQYLASPTDIKLTYSDGTVEHVAVEEVYDQSTHELNVPITKRLVGGDSVVVSFETIINDGAVGETVENTAYVDGKGLVGGYTSADYIFDTAQGTISEILTQVDGTENKDVPTASDYLSLIPDAEDTVSTDEVKKIVHFVDEEGNELVAPAEVSSGELKKIENGPTGTITYEPETGTLGAVPVADIPNWEIKELPQEVFEEQTVKFGDDDLHYKVVYMHHKTISTDSVKKIVRYVDEEGNELAPATVLNSDELKKIVDDVTGAVSYEPESASLDHKPLPELANWEVKDLPEEVLQDQVVKFGDEDLEFTVVYRERTTETSTSETETSTSETETSTTETSTSETETSTTEIGTSETETNTTEPSTSETETSTSESSSSTTEDTASSSSKNEIKDTTQTRDSSSDAKKLPATGERLTPVLTIAGIVILGLAIKLKWK